MQKFYEVAGEVMGFFDAFKGSRPAINNEKILIVRGRSRKTLDVNDFNSKLDEIGSIINGEEIESNSAKIAKLLEIGDKSIQESEGQTGNIDKHGYPPLYVEVTVSEKEE